MPQAAGRRVLPQVLRCCLSLAWFMRRFRDMENLGGSCCLTVRWPGTL